ncbi:hypothetical protein CEXT_279481 [Caerostris extrusa]|uniref:Uncharacterized protein n=1 Tax=Caerostris extrusa TaxID=172846 RepID=A0AAV4QZS1_CAEEX|nr:hypothetical protein CEXT_279481 [Caerostris extrusa]
MLINMKKNSIHIFHKYLRTAWTGSFSPSSDIRVKINDGVPMIGMRTFQKTIGRYFDRFGATNNENIRRNPSFSRSTEETLLVALTWV